MASVGEWKVWCCVFFVLLRVIKTEYVLSDRLVRKGPAPEFSRHTVIKPRTYHGREKREITSTKEEGAGHIHDLTIGYDINGKDYVLDLRLNRELVPKSYFERYQHNGQHVVNKPTGKDVELCQYQGKLRGLHNSWAAISTCHGLSGVIFDGEELHYLERGSTDEGGGGDDDEDRGENGISSPHYLYRHSDVKTNQTCGYSGTSHHILDNQEFNRILRYKRSTDTIRGPYNANKQSRYVELVLVVDNKEYKELGESREKVNLHCKEIANIINALYVPLNIFITLVGVVVWTEYDEITLSSNGDTTLTNFLHYRRERLVKEHPNDNAQLLTRVQFDGGVVGKALKGPICTFEFSGGVSMDHSNVVGLVATTVAHEMGHNFGMEHDTNDCECPSDRCIMAPSSSSMSPTQWSSCSLEYLALAFEHGMDYCLRNKPQSLFDSPVCGNLFVESGEQCDCGMKGHCDNPCCNASTCMLYPNASCATGECCDLKTCRPKTAGTMCRSADHECDLPEYCTGQSEYCPDDVFKIDGETCDRGKAFCYQGSCRTHTDQCRLLWGPSGKSSDLQCYQMNTKGTRHGNCGYNRLNQSYMKCNDENIYCGMLHCKHLNERLEFGMESVAILSHSFINSGGSIIPCRTAIIDLGLNQVDPGLAPDGAKCGEGKMCVNQKCMAVGSLRQQAGAMVCPQDCNGNGVCNSRGHCHCAVGYAPPHCDYPGTGGSEDSGPASDPNARRDVMTALYVIFLGIVPFVALIAIFMYYTRRNVKYWWKKGSSHPAASTQQPSSKSGDKKPPPPTRRISRGNSMAFRGSGNLANGVRGLEISNPLPADGSGSSDSAHVSLLPKYDVGNGVGPTAKPSNSVGADGAPVLQNNFFGQFKGFTITPLSSNNSSPTKLPASPSRTQPATSVSPPVVPAVHIKSPKSVNLPARVTGTVTSTTTTTTMSTAQAVPLNNQLPIASRPVISSPILDATTCTAKELISSTASVPSRPAPEVPTNSTETSGYTPLTGSTSKPARPLSSPNTLAVSPFPAEEKKSKDSGPSYPTLTRLASFMMRQNQGGKEKEKEKGGTNSLPRNHHHGVKASKLQLDREALRNLQISNPIPQQDIDVPETAVPVRPAPSPPPTGEASKTVVMRAQSLRDKGPVTQRPSIPTFGSMRQPSGTKRPTSIPAGTRPTSPPPPRPPPPPSKPGEIATGIIGVPGYQNPPAASPADYCYDDCFNLLSDPAPLANIDEETSPNSADNIYAVIEESPPESSRKMGRGYTPPSEYAAPVPPKSSIDDKQGTVSKFEYTSPTFSEYKSPKPVENSISAGSVESVGLLSEIVNEIQARNMESIYSTSTLGRKKEGKGEGSDLDDTASTITATDSSIAGSASPRLLRDKSSVVASSNSSLGTYVNANSYRPGSSVYSNLSTQASSPHMPSTGSCSSSNSGYLSPMTVNSSKTPVTTQASVVSANNSSRGMSTFRTPLQTTNTLATATPAADTKKTTTLPDNVSTYKPYSSSLQRSLGPLAASFRGTSSSVKDNKTETMSTEAVKPQNTVPTLPNRGTTSKSPPSPVTSLKVTSDKTSVGKSSNASTQPGRTSLHRTPTPPSLSVKTGNAVTKPAASATKVTPTATINSSALHRGKSPGVGMRGQTPPANNSPDLVSSCSVGGGSGRSPDVVGSSKVDGKANLKSPDVVAGAKPLPSLPTRSTTPSSTSSVSRSASAASGASTKSTTPAAGTRLPSVHSSFKGTSAVKQPQLAPKPSLAKPAASGSTSSSVSQQDKAKVGTATAKDVTGKVAGVGRGTSVTKSASDVTSGSSKSMPAAARAAANKLSHVASLQQKFETAAASEKGGVTVGRTPSSTANKTRPTQLGSKTTPAETSTGRNVGFKK
ncbi:uncharacterized protein Meltrin [Periplaneta americana]|uniref:uncharacterized protein Meltrin n=1 Tax=Periplaneta americana TaxID=6978 RepID=UPI0037E8DC78